MSISRPRSYQRSWWVPEPSMNQRLCIYFNTYITPEKNDYSVRIITKHVLERIFMHLPSMYIFQGVNHFITRDRMFKTTEDYDLVVFCMRCYLLHTSKNPPTEGIFNKMRGNEHFTFPPSMIFNILEMPTMWCHQCRIKNFKWYTDHDCINCT